MKKIAVLIALLITAVCILAFRPVKETPFVVIIPSYNNQNWVKQNIQSVARQKYKNFRVIYINDNSQDATSSILKEFLKTSAIDSQILTFDPSLFPSMPERAEHFHNLINHEPHFFTLIENSHRSGALANLYLAIHSCRDDEVMVTVDGDDWLHDARVLSKLNKAYLSDRVWLTHGTLIEYPKGSIRWSEAIPQDIIAQNAFREFKCPSHLRTFYAWLFKKIALEDLLYEGQFFPMTWDMAIMYPMIEMCGPNHAFLSDVNYVYNVSNPLNDNKVDADLQNALDRYIRNAPRYQPLEIGQK